MAAFELSKMGHSIYYLGWGDTNKPSWLIDFKNIHYLVKEKIGFISAVKLLKDIIIKMVNIRPDLIYIQGAQQTPLILWLLIFKKKPVIYHTQDFLGPGQHYFYELCEKLISRRANYVIINEPNRARFFASNYKIKNFPEIIRTALPSWWKVPVRNDEIRSQLVKKTIVQDSKGARLIVAGGGYHNSRMSPELLEGFSFLPNNFILIFTGMEYKSKQQIACEKHIKKLGLDNRIIFLGKLSYSELLNVYAACDIGILLYPNNGVGHYYQAPGRLTEYLRCGLSIVCSNFPNLELLNLQHKLGEVADPYCSSSIKDAIFSLGNLSDEELELNRVRLLIKAENEFNYEIQAKPVLSKLIEEISEGNNHEILNSN